MSDKTGIEWTDSTWNPVRGCSRVSDGCKHCYAEREAARFSGPGMPYEGFATKRNGEPRWTGRVRLIAKKLREPLSWTGRRRVFVNSMSDLFHEELCDDDIDQVFRVMAIAKQHTFQILTKRPERMREYCTRLAGDATLSRAPSRWPFPNVWLLVSAEHQAAADERLPQLMATPAAVRGVSAEPLLGPIDFTTHLYGRAVTCDACPRDADCSCGYQTRVRNAEQSLDWIIVGGESGPGARPMHPDWARSIRDQCAAARVAFFFKQWGEYEPVRDLYAGDENADNGRGELLPVDRMGNSWPRFQPPVGSWLLERVGKKRAGRLLDGRTHDEFPA